MEAACALCQRIPKRGTTQHHLIPRTCHSNKWFKKNFTRQRMRATIALCRDCHLAIHRFVPNAKQLGRHYNTVERLLDHELLGRFVAWARRQK